MKVSTAFINIYTYLLAYECMKELSKRPELVPYLNRHLLGILKAYPDVAGSRSSSNSIHEGYAVKLLGYNTLIAMFHSIN